MIVLDTNVISELMKPDPDPAVVSWLDSAVPESVWTTSITVFEVRYGLELLEGGPRRNALVSAFDAVLHNDLDRRVMDFDILAAEKTVEIGARARKDGNPVDLRDSMIAGIVASQGASLVTRNVRQFENAGIDLVNPWEGG